MKTETIINEPEAIQEEMRDLGIVTETVEIKIPVLQPLGFGILIPEETRFIPVSTEYYQQIKAAAENFNK